MKSKHINLHMDQKRALCLVAFFSLIVLLINVVIGIAINSDISQLNSLLKSKYEYSVTVRNPIGKDDYYQFDAGISFALSEEAITSINADIIMQVNNSEYSNLVNWNAQSLGTYEVAITKSVARAYGLSLGDKIYSKHIVNDGMNAYSIVEILPEATSAKTLKAKNYSKGIIVMGCDNSYVENLSHAYISFTDLKISDLEANALENIVYRDDEIATIVKRLLPYIVVLLMITVLMAYGQSLLCTRSMKHNFKRLATLGFEKKELDCSFSRMVYGLGMISLVIASVASAIVFRVINLCLSEIWILVILFLLGAATLFVAVGFLKRQLWRK